MKIKVIGIDGASVIGCIYHKPKPVMDLLPMSGEYKFATISGWVILVSKDGEKWEMATSVEVGGKVMDRASFEEYFKEITEE